VLERGDKIAFVGRNGEGKTTLLKLLAGAGEARESAPQLLEGSLEEGHQVNTGYYAQIKMNCCVRTILSFKR